MKVLDAEELHAGLKRNIEMLHRLEGEMQNIEQTIKELTQMEESLKGQGGEALRSFYAACHLPFLQFFMTIKASFTDILEQIGSALTSLEPDQSGFIEQDYLQVEVEQGINRARDTTVELTNETNAIMDEMSDIVSLPKLDDSEVIIGIVNAKKYRNQTVTDLLEFDQTQTNALNTVQLDLLHMKNWLNNIEAMMKEGVTDVHFPAQQWKGYALQHPLQLILGYRNSPLSTIKEMGLIGQPGSVYQTLTYTFSGNLSIEYPLFQPSKDSVNVVPTSTNMQFEEGLSCPRPGQEKNNLSDSEIQVYIDQAVEEIEVIDEYASEGNDINGTYFTLSDGRILRKYYGKTDIEYEFVQSIPNERIGGVQHLEDEVPIVKTIDEVTKALLIDDIETVLDPETSGWDKGLALSGFLPIGKIGKVDDLLDLKNAADTAQDIANTSKKGKNDKAIESVQDKTKGKDEEYVQNEQKNENDIKVGDYSPIAPGGGLAAHEAKGGHLIERHVEKTDDELRKRLENNAKISGSSSFKDREAAEKVANSVLNNPKNIEKIEKWLDSPKGRPTLLLNYKGNGEVLGRSIDRETNVTEDVTNAKIVLKKDKEGSFIITGYPTK